MNKIIIVSGPVIVEKKKVLLDISGEDAFWKFCGGRGRDGESLAGTAIRRAKEELGISVDIIDKIPFLMYKNILTQGGSTEIILSHFLAKRTGGIAPGSDVKKWKWIEINNLPDNVGSNIKPALKHFKLI